MEKREFLKVAGVVTAGSIILPLASCNPQASSEEESPEKETKVNTTTFELPALAYGFDALAPNIDARTMEIHHGKHHAGYVRKLNAALEGNTKFAGQSLEEILAAVGEEDTSVRNNGGGHFNHTLFWDSMSPNGGGTPEGDLKNAIDAAFGSFEAFQDQFSTAAKTRFGSGWAWLCKDAEGKLFVTYTPNQDNPLMTNLAEAKGTPILGLDVWEHAYYLNYQNRRGDYIANFYNVIDWAKVGSRLG
ncbi:MAG: superoxide dismutase [Bacteroidota bacterium]